MVTFNDMILWLLVVGPVMSVLSVVMGFGIRYNIMNRQRHMKLNIGDLSPNVYENTENGDLTGPY